MKFSPSELALKPGDLVVILCTARKVAPEALSAAVTLLEKEGFRVQFGDSVGASHHQFGGDDTLRRTDLQKALDNPEVRAILVARGGYGTIRLLDSLDPTGFLKEPKWVAGFSDVTALHGWLQRHGAPSLHAPMPALFDAVDERSLQSLMQGLRGKPFSLRSDSHTDNIPGKARGRLVGGNLSMLYSMRGTPIFPDTNGAILALEDLDEYLYHIDRMMQNFKLGDILANLNGVLVGGMTDMHDHDIPFGGSATSIISDALKGYNIPVAHGMPFGHGAINHSLMLGKEVLLEVTKKGSHMDYLL